MKWIGDMNMNAKETIYYPQDEMTTVLVPVTSGCSYNKCAFCGMYKDYKYEQLPFSDIETVLMNTYEYTERVFLTGAEPLSIGYEKMVKLLNMIKKHIPYCACVASYASIKNVEKYSVEQLSILHNLGLRLLYIGFETGRDDILEKMNKQHRRDEAITQARKLNEANLIFNSIILYGIAGKDESVSNAIATADMINHFNTNKVITMNLTVFADTELSRMVDRGEFTPSIGYERMLELKTLIENLDPKKDTIFDTTHPTNIIKIKGILPKDKNILLEQLESYMNIMNT